MLEREGRAPGSEKLYTLAEVAGLEDDCSGREAAL